MREGFAKSAITFWAMIKFSSAGGVVRVELAELEDAIELRVIDYGVGIDPSEQERIFEPFEQVDSSLARQHEGTGLELALVKRLVTLHGGTVGVQSKLGEGSDFWVRFPYEPHRTDV